MHGKLRFTWILDWWSIRCKAVLRPRFSNEGILEGNIVDYESVFQGQGDPSSTRAEQACRLFGYIGIINDEGYVSDDQSGAYSTTEY